MLDISHISIEGFTQGYEQTVGDNARKGAVRKMHAATAFIAVQSSSGVQGLILRLVIPWSAL